MLSFGQETRVELCECKVGLVFVNNMLLKPANIIWLFLWIFTRQKNLSEKEVQIIEL